MNDFYSSISHQCIHRVVNVRDLKRRKVTDVSLHAHTRRRAQGYIRQGLALECCLIPLHNILNTPITREEIRVSYVSGSSVRMQLQVTISERWESQHQFYYRGTAIIEDGFVARPGWDNRARKSPVRPQSRATKYPSIPKKASLTSFRSITHKIARSSGV